MKIVLSVFLFLLFHSTTFSQSVKFEWANSIGGTFEDVGSSITADALGNVYLTGWYNGTVDFDPSASTFNLTSNGLSDVFIQKLDAYGNCEYVN